MNVTVETVKVQISVYHRKLMDELLRVINAEDIVYLISKLRRRKDYKDPDVSKIATLKAAITRKDALIAKLYAENKELKKVKEEVRDFVSLQDQVKALQTVNKEQRKYIDALEKSKVRHYPEFEPSNTDIRRVSNMLFLFMDCEEESL